MEEDSENEELSPFLDLSTEGATYTSPSQPSTSRRQDGPLCGICGKPMCEEDLHTLECGHQFHIACVVSMSEMSWHKCTICLQAITDMPAPAPAKTPTENECVICFGEIAEVDRRVLGCGHKSHRRCIDNMAEMEWNRCPVCLQDISMTESPAHFSSPLVVYTQTGTSRSPEEETITLPITPSPFLQETVSTTPASYLQDTLSATPSPALHETVSTTPGSYLQDTISLPETPEPTSASSELQIPPGAPESDQLNITPGISGPAQQEQQQQLEECAICLEIILRQDADFLTCGHKFHKDCLDRLRDFRGSSTIPCPICRQVDTSQDDDEEEIDEEEDEDFDEDMVHGDIIDELEDDFDSDMEVLNEIENGSEMDDEENDYDDDI